MTNPRVPKQTVNNVQVTYRKQGDSHFFFGADRMSTGVMVGNKDLLKALDEVDRQLEKSLQDNHQITAKVSCTLKRNEVEKYLKDLPQAVLLWSINSWVR